jgi:hypothetical protein
MRLMHHGWKVVADGLVKEVVPGRVVPGRVFV